MSSNSKVTPTTPRRAVIGLAGLAASASVLKTAWGAEPGPFLIKRASLLQRKGGISHEEFVKHWVEIHAPMARACPGIAITQCVWRIHKEDMKPLGNIP